MSVTVNDKNLGHATAYAYAKSKGYTGTEEEFAELMASYATVAEAAAESAEQAASSASAASGSASTANTAAQTATTKASEAAQSATNAQQSATNASSSASAASTSASNANTSAQTAATKADEASQSATNAAASATTANTAKNDAVTAKDDAVTAKTAAETAKTGAETAKTEAEAAAEEATQIVGNKADKDGIYPDMAVGSLMSEEYTTEQMPYLYRVSGGGIEVGKVEADEIVGGTIAWNQRFEAVNGAVAGNQGTSSLSSGTWTLTCNTESATNFGFYSVNASLRGLIANHVTLVSAKINPSVGGTVRFGLDSRPTRYESTANTWMQLWSVAKPSANSAITCYMSATTGDTMQVKEIVNIDLTQMFGTTIADYLYSLETATAGAGVALFRKMFPNAYYPYNAGELMHVTGVSEHVMTGFNQWDEEWEVGAIDGATGQNTVNTATFRSTNYIPVLKQNYYLTNGSNYTVGLRFYDSNKTYLDSYPVVGTDKSLVYGTSTLPTNTAFIRFVVTTTNKYNYDICINLSSDRNGEYEPYEKKSYALDSSLTLRGIPKLSNNQIYWDGDTYTADGVVTRKYGIVDLGSLTWEAWTGYAGVYRTSLPANCKTMPNNNTLPNWIASTYKTVIGTDISANDKTIGQLHQTYLVVHDDAYSTAAALKTALNGVYLVYELATPTTEQADAYEEYQHVTNGGTEEYVSTGIVPVGHNTKYYGDIGSKVDGLPSDFSTIIAPTEKAFKATRAYTVNELIIINNVLYKVTSAIANGATITPNTNVQQTTLSALIKALS